jgi:DegV family protein with EDD domain
VANIKIVTDSSADIPKALLDELGITVVPLKVHFGEETYVEGVDITAETFYPKLVSSDRLPTTSQPSPADFLEAYKKLATEPGDEIISLHISSALSGTYQSAVLAKQLLEEQIPVHIVDTRYASFGHGVMVVTAARMAREGKSAEEILEAVAKKREGSQIYFIVDTLQYLYKGGRIGKASALFGSLLNIKPILTVDEAGEVAPVDKVRGQKNALSRMIELLEKDMAGRNMELYVGHAAAPEMAQQLKDLIVSRLNVEPKMFIDVGPIIGTHAGPGTLAVFAFPE